MPGPIDFNAKPTATNANRGGIKNDTNPQNSKEKMGSIFDAKGVVQGQVSGTVPYEGTVSYTNYENGIAVGKVDIPHQGTVEIPYEVSYGANDAVNNPEKREGAQAKDDVVERFKQLDKDGDLKVSADEYINDFIDECRSNGYGAAPGQNFADIIAEKYEEFKKFAGEDVSMNIDEFRNMVEERLNPTSTSGADNSPPPPSDAY